MAARGAAAAAGARRAKKKIYKAQTSIAESDKEWAQLRGIAAQLSQAQFREVKTAFETFDEDLVKTLRHRSGPCEVLLCGVQYRVLSWTLFTSTYKQKDIPRQRKKSSGKSARNS